MTKYVLKECPIVRFIWSKNYIVFASVGHLRWNNPALILNVHNRLPMNKFEPKLLFIEHYSFSKIFVSFDPSLESNSSNLFFECNRDWLPKFGTGLNCLNKHRSKNIWVTILTFCQNDSLMGGSLCQKDRMVTHMPIKHFSPVANFGNQSLDSTRFINISASVVIHYKMPKSLHCLVLHKNQTAPP